MRIDITLLVVKKCQNGKKRSVLWCITCDYKRYLQWEIALGACLIAFDNINIPIMWKKKIIKCDEEIWVNICIWGKSVCILLQAIKPPKRYLKCPNRRVTVWKKIISRFWQPGRRHLNSENPRLELCWIVRLLSPGVYLHWNLLSFLSNFVEPVTQFQIYFWNYQCSTNIFL